MTVPLVGGLPVMTAAGGLPLPADPSTGTVPGTGVVNVQRMLAIPAVGRALGLIEGLICQMPLQAVSGPVILPTPRLLQAPDPTRSLSWWLAGEVRDWWLHGNAVQYVTVWDKSTGLPAAVAWLPVERLGVVFDDQGRMVYTLDGIALDSSRIIHVRRGADPMAPWRGVGVLEQHMPTWARLADQEQYEAGVLRGSAVPSVVITSNNPDLTQVEADNAKTAWMAKHSGPVREPAIFPQGTEIKTLAWSPQDQQLNETRQLSLTEVANIANLDGYWLGASTTGYSYKSPGPMYLNLIRQTIGPILTQLEQAWSPEWLPAGQEVKADRQAVLGDDMGTTITWLVAAVEGGLLTLDEARAYIGKSPLQATGA